MLSRSSSAYQPLDSAATASNKKGSDRTGLSGAAGPACPTNPDDEPLEMTSIAVISQHPFRSGATPTISTVPMVGSSAGCELDPTLDLDYALCSNDGEKGAWTNFHFVMCIGIVGFFVFWIVLLCRMYLPPEFQFWTQISGSGAAGAGGAAGPKNLSENSSKN